MIIKIKTAIIFIARTIGAKNCNPGINKSHDVTLDEPSAFEKAPIKVCASPLTAINPLPNNESLIVFIISTIQSAKYI